MRFEFLVLAAVLAAHATPAVAADDACRKAVEDAFVKQRSSKAFRSVLTHPAANDGSEQVYQYAPPLLMHRTLTAPGLEGASESIGFGNRAWSAEGGAWIELQPHFAQPYIAHLREMFGAPPSIKTEYKCLGEAAFEGATFEAYQTLPEKTDDGEMVVRTVYVDAKSGLPAGNTVGTLDGTKPLLVKETYTYPDKIDIVIPEGAPMQSLQH